MFLFVKMYAATEQSRKKTCKQCRVAKTRCDLRVPTCGRCEKKRFGCGYEKPTWDVNSANSSSDGLYRTWLVESKTSTQDGPTRACQTAGGTVSSNISLNIQILPDADRDEQNCFIRRDRVMQPATTVDGRQAGRQPNGVPQKPSNQHDMPRSFSPISDNDPAELLQEMRTENALLDEAMHEDAEMTDALALDSELSMMKITSNRDHWKAIDSVSEMVPNMLNRKRLSSSGSSPLPTPFGPRSKCIQWNLAKVACLLSYTGAP